MSLPRPESFSVSDMDMDLNLNLTSNCSNISTSGPSVFLDSSVLVLVVLRAVCFLVGIPGNIAVIILKPNFNQLSKVIQGLMINLAMSDLLCLVTLPVWIYELLYGWTLGVVTCKIITFFVHCSLNSSVLTVTALSIQRYMQVVHQQRCLQFKKRLLILLWIISVALSIPPLVVRQTIKDQQQKTICLPVYSSPAQQVSMLLTECFVGFSAFAVTSCAYFFLKRKLDQAVFFNSLWTSKLITGLIATFFALWMPYLVFNLVVVGGIFKNNLKITEFHILGLNIFSSIVFINTCLNPLLYAFAIKIWGKNTNTTSGNSEEPATTTVAVS